MDPQPVLDEDQLNDADRDILDALHRGRGSPSYLSDVTGHEQTYINQRLRRLEEHGHVDNLARGLWELTDDPRLEGEDDEEFVPREEYDHVRERLQECRDRLTSEGVDVDVVEGAFDDIMVAVDRGDREMAEDAIERIREAIDS